MKSKVVGQSIKRRDAFSKVTGSAKYPGDFADPDQLTLKILKSLTTKY